MSVTEANAVTEKMVTVEPKDLFVHKNVLALNNKLCCKYHPDANLIDDQETATMICPECGIVVVEQMISEEAEWRNHADDSLEKNWSRNRVGGAANRFLSSETNLATSISAVDRMNEYGQSIVQNQRSRNVDKAMMAAFRHIEEMSDRINLPQSVYEKAQYLYHKIYETRRLKGNVLDNDVKTAACLFIACHQENCPRTLKEIAAISDKSARLINKMQRKIMKELNISKTIIDSNELLPRFCSQLYLPLGVRKRASQIVEAAKAMNNVKMMFPETVAAASIYIAQSTQSPEEKRTQKDIGQSVGLTSQTISRTSRLITNHLNQMNTS